MNSYFLTAVLVDGNYLLAVGPTDPTHVQVTEAFRQLGSEVHLIGGKKIGELKDPRQYMLALRDKYKPDDFHDGELPSMVMDEVTYRNLEEKLDIRVLNVRLQ